MEQPIYLTMPQSWRLLKVSRPTLFRWLKNPEKHLPHRMIDRRTGKAFFIKGELLDWLKSQSEPLMEREIAA